MVCPHTGVNGTPLDDGKEAVRSWCSHRSPPSRTRNSAQYGSVHLKSTWPGYAVHRVLALCHYDNEITGVQRGKVYFSLCFLRSPSIVAVDLCWGHKVWEVGSMKQKKLLNWSPGNKARPKGVRVSTAPSRAQPCDLTPSHSPIPTCYGLCPAPNTAAD